MGEVKEFKIDGYRPFFGYFEGIKVLYAPSQDAFRTGLLYDYIGKECMTEKQADEARSMSITESFITGAEDWYAEKLSINNFELTPE